MRNVLLCGVLFLATPVIAIGLHQIKLPKAVQPSGRLTNLVTVPRIRRAPVPKLTIREVKEIATSSNLGNSANLVATLSAQTTFIANTASLTTYWVDTVQPELNSLLVAEVPGRNPAVSTRLSLNGQGHNYLFVYNMRCNAATRISVSSDAGTTEMDVPEGNQNLPVFVKGDSGGASATVRLLKGRFDIETVEIYQVN